jgi:ribosome-associated translation inhibitor RaiA
MRLVLTGRHVDITPGIRRLVDGKLARLERLLGDSFISAQITLSRE